MSDELKPTDAPTDAPKEEEAPKSDGTCPVHDCGCRGPLWKCTCHLQDDEYRLEN